LKETSALDRADKKVDAYICKLKSPQKEVCQRLREIIHKSFPEIKEEVKWGVPSFGSGKFYIVALKDHVNLGFSLAGLSEEEKKLLDGSGKTMKHIEIGESKDIDEKKIVQLLEMVHSKK
jgi:hypothetical protein